MKYLFKHDTVFATLSIFLVIGLLYMIPLNTHFLDPLKASLSDVNFNDLSYSTLHLYKKNPVEKDVIIVNMERGDRQQIAEVLKRLAQAGPRAIGLDLLFDGPRDSLQDKILSETIRRIPQLVLAYRLNPEEKEKLSENYFIPSGTNSGYVNFVGEEKGVIRYFSPFESYPDTVYSSFTVALLKLASAAKYQKLVKRGISTEIINYSRGEDQYIILSADDILSDKVDKVILKNKILLLGYVSGSPYDIEDRHFTPLNEKFIGKSIPDMNGVIIHANILSMMLSGNYIQKIPAWLNLLIAVLISWLFMAFCIRYFVEMHMWFHLITKAVQLAMAILFIYLGIMSRIYFGISLNFALVLLTTILSVDIVYFYEGLAKWLHRKWGFSTVFLNIDHSG